jgi:hypothetical protein
MSTEDQKFSKINDVKGRVMDQDNNINPRGIIDSAKFDCYNKDTNTVVIRIDDTNVPGFWLEIPLNLNQLQDWIKYNEDIDL